MLNSVCGKSVTSKLNMGSWSELSWWMCTASSPWEGDLASPTAHRGLRGPTAIGLLLLCALSPSSSSTETCRALRLSLQAGVRPTYWEVTSV